MTPKKQFSFDGFRLDATNECLWRGQKAIPLTPKDFAVLLYLAENSGRLVTKEELLKAIWPETYVGEGVLKVSIRKIRRALEDDPAAPQFIETLHRRGYRFIASVTEIQQPGADRRSVVSLREDEPGGLSSTVVVGRERELAQLRAWFEQALRGERQVVFVVGEAGIGKTTVVETFLERAAAERHLWVARGQCLEQYGASEPYLPVLEAFSRLCREPERKQVVTLLARRAPTWLVQMPWLVSDAECELLRRVTQGATSARMLREMTEALEAITAEAPLALVLEDMHWSDYSTLDLIASLARRQELARLLVIATYRPVEVILKGHPLKAVRQELHMHRQCRELSLDFLTEMEVAEYLTARFPQCDLPAELSQLIYQRTDGNPFFMTNVMDYLLARGLVVQFDGRWQLRVALEEIEVGVPESVRQMIDKQIDYLGTKEQRVLAAASVVGMEFSVATVAAGLQMEIVEVEECCEALARRSQFLRRAGMSEYPDGSVMARYCFIHNLYQGVLYDWVAAARRVQLHQRIGEHGQLVYGERAGEIAAELAMHFECGRDHRQAVIYLLQAARNAAQRFAHREVIALLSKALELLKTLPDDIESASQELKIQTAMGTAWISTKGPSAPEVEQAYARARGLCQEVGDTLQLFMILRGQWAYYNLVHSQTARELGEGLLSLAQTANDPALLLEAHRALGWNLFFRGEFTLARSHLEQAIAPYNPEQHCSHASLYGMDPALMSRCHAGLTLWCLGYPDQALKSCDEGITLAPQPSHPFTQAGALIYTASVHQLRGESRKTLELAEKAIALSAAHGLPFWEAVGTVLCGWVLARHGQLTEGIALMQEGLAAYQATGAQMSQPWCLALLAEAHEKSGRPEAGLAALAEAAAVIERSGEFFYQAELYRLKGEILLALPEANLAEAEDCFRRAIEIARRQQAKSFELRAVMSLSRLYKSQGQREEARGMLERNYGWFTEGFTTADLQEAKSLIGPSEGKLREDLTN